MNTESRNISIDIIGSIAIAILGVSFGAFVDRIALRQEAAKEGVGEYSVNPLTGSTRFKWKPANNSQSTSNQFQAAIGISLQNSTDIAYLVKLYDQVDRGMTDIFKRVTELEHKRYDQFLQPRWDGQTLTNTWPPQWQTSTNIYLDVTGTNVYMTNLYLGQGVTITNGMLYIQN